MLWFIGGFFVFLLLRFLWQSYIHPANVVARQAANMNWVVMGRTENPEGGKDVLLGRDGLLTKINWRTGAVMLLNPTNEEAFNDYIAIERWLALRTKQLQDKAESLIREKAAFEDLYRLQEEKFSKEPSMDVNLNSSRTETYDEKIYRFMLSVQEQLFNGHEGESLLEIDKSFRLTSPEYLKITTELFEISINLNKSPIEVSTYLIMAFAAANEEKSITPITGVIVYLRTAIDYLKTHSHSNI